MGEQIPQPAGIEHRARPEDPAVRDAGRAIAARVTMSTGLLTKTITASGETDSRPGVRSRARATFATAVPTLPAPTTDSFVCRRILVPVSPMREIVAYTGRCR
ncbi:hypothetical protein NJ76_14325 [Rhodococcus sp. IITR03]|nr:hypothetical protein NJ76_14325 [Rhodococcus sp. IITR03]